MSPLVDGAAFVLDAPEHVPAIWGASTNVLWSQGEPLILCGPPGVGKSTLIQQVVRARAGIGDTDVLGYPVAADERPVLYLAADRPAQIARSMRRLYTNADRNALSQRLKVHRGPLSWSPLDDPGRLARQAAELGVGTVVIDSLKDLFASLSSEEVGSAVKAMLVACCEAGIETVALHHQRKANGENKKPTYLADVYGSTWITAGAGSVVLLWGDAGDPLVELIHLKAPADEVGPHDITHDHDAGVSTRAVLPTVLELVRDSLPIGITAPDAADATYPGKPTAAQVEKVRRRLERLVRDGLADKLESDNPRLEPTIYRPTSAAFAAQEAVDPRGPSTWTPHATSTQVHEAHEHGPRDVHGPKTGATGDLTSRREVASETVDPGVDPDLVPTDDELVDQVQAAFDAQELDHR